MAALCLVTAGAIASAQKPSADKAAAKANKTGDAGGLRRKAGSAPNQFTLADEQSGSRGGRRPHRSIRGQRVEISRRFPDNSKFKVKGGLWPTANVAGQAGAIDPVRAAGWPQQPGGPSSATGEVDLPKVNVKSIGGGCSGCEVWVNRRSLSYNAPDESDHPHLRIDAVLSGAVASTAFQSPARQAPDPRSRGGGDCRANRITARTRPIRFRLRIRCGSRR
jgi:hypothetical protein